MSMARSPSLVRLMALSAAAVFALGVPVVAATKTATRAPATAAAKVPATAKSSATTAASAQSTSALKKKRAHNGAAAEQSELNAHVRKLTESLKLSDEQEVQVKSILQARMGRAAELRAKFKGEPATPENRAALEKARDGLRAETDAKLAQVLTIDQMVEYRKIMNEHAKEEAKEGTK